METLIEKLNNTPICVKGLDKKRKETPVEFLYNFLTDWNLKLPTIYLDGELQTPPGRRRSMDDIWLIMQYYYPLLSFKEFCQILYIDIHTKPSIRSSPCFIIRKRVFYYNRNHGVIYDRNSKDQHGYTFKDYINYATSTT